MRSVAFSAMVFCIVQFGAGRATAQFYAPDTDYHDLAQRLFPVELARVLAWRADPRQERIAEVTYRVETDEADGVTWRIAWRDAAGGIVRETDLKYPVTLAARGLDYYREVFGQLCPAEWRPKPASAPSQVVREFWRGADRAGMSRVETLREALKLAAERAARPEQELAPRLAGLMSHGALACPVDSRMLDACLLARAAAWLCVAEAGCRERDAQLDALWAPILFLSRREYAAQRAWGKPAGLPASLAEDDGAWCVWNQWLRLPSVREAFERAAPPVARPVSFAMMAYYSRLAGSGPMLTQAIYVIAEHDPSLLERIYDYDAFLGSKGGIAGGRLIDGFGPALARKAWIKLLAESEFPPLDRPAYDRELRAAKEGIAAAGRDQDVADASLIGFDAAAPLIELGYREGKGKLIPVAVVTVRDLLNYGWEDTCVQMSQRFGFVKIRWGVEELGEKIIAPITEQITGVDLLASSKRIKLKVTSPRKLDDVKRFQWLEGWGQLGDRLSQPGVWSKESPRENAALYRRRMWLRDNHLQWQLFCMVRAEDVDEVSPFVKRAIAEGGPKSDMHLMHGLRYAIESKFAKRMSDNLALREQIAARLPGPTWEAAESLWDKYLAMPPLKRAQTWEKMFWENPSLPLDTEIFRGYAQAHAYDAAKRFYDQSARFIEDRVRFSNGTGPLRFALALAENDAAGMRLALRDSATGSYRHMIMNATACFARDDLDEARRWLETATERYASARDPKGEVAKLLGFMPLTAALKDPRHPDYEKALDYFERDDRWPTTQWIMIRNYKLPKEDAIRFLGGDKTDPQRRLMILNLRGDKAAFAKEFASYLKSSKRTEMASITIAHLAHQILQTPPPHQPDLKPPGIVPLAEAMQAELEKHRQRRNSPPVPSNCR